MTLREAIEQYVFGDRLMAHSSRPRGICCVSSSVMPTGTPGATWSPRRRFWPFWRARAR